MPGKVGQCPRVHMRCLARQASVPKRVQGERLHGPFVRLLFLPPLHAFTCGFLTVDGFIWPLFVGAGNTHRLSLAVFSDWHTHDIVDASTYNPERTAFFLLRELYAWFGHTEEDLPYTEGTGDEKRISTTAITAMG
jgi:hypothetical protein